MKMKSRLILPDDALKMLRREVDNHRDVHLGVTQDKNGRWHMSIAMQHAMLIHPTPYDYATANTICNEVKAYLEEHIGVEFERPPTRH